MTADAGRQIDKVDALVIFGATGDLAKLETFPALVGHPDAQVGLRLVGKRQRAGWALRQEDLVFGEQRASDMRTYARLIGAALSGQHWLFARQDMVEAAWRVVDPVLGNVVPLHGYPKDSWGP